jgi:hypothetical protein
MHRWHPNAAMIRANREVQIPTGLVEHEGHPESNEACGHPRIVVHPVFEADVTDTVVVQFAKTSPCVLGGAAEPDVSVAVAVRTNSAMIEPRFTHYDRRQRIGDEPWCEVVSAPDIVVPDQ